MSFRDAFIVGLTIMIGALFYFPSRYSANTYFELLDIEQADSASVMDQSATEQVLRRTIQLAETLNASKTSRTDIPRNSSDRLVRQRWASMTYVEAVKASFVLALFRASLVLQLAPLLAAIAVAAIVDGFVVRAVRSRLVMAHSAEAFSACVISSLLLGFSLAVCLCAPLQVHSAVPAGLLLLMSLLIGRAIANYHVIR